MTPDLPPPPIPPPFEVSAEPVRVFLQGEEGARVALPVRRYAWFLEVEDYAILLDEWSLVAEQHSESWRLAALSAQAENDLVVSTNADLRVENAGLRKAASRGRSGAVVVGVAGVTAGLTLGLLAARR